jgi:hypothetical protein
LREADPARYEQVLMQLRRYDERLGRFGLRDRHLDWQVSTGDAVIFGIREIALGIVLLPLCAAGLVLFFVPYQLTGLVARRVARGYDIIATAQVFAGAAIYAAWVAILATVIWMLTGRTAAIVAALMTPVLAVAGLFAIERETAVLDAVRAWWLLGRAHRDTWERMRRRRSELADLLDEVNGWLEGNQARTGEPA